MRKSYIVRNKAIVKKIADLEASIRAAMISISTEKHDISSPYPIHLALGHERLSAACSIIACSADRFILTHRNIHFNLGLTDAKKWDRIKDEAVGQRTGINNGAYGCMTMRASERVSYTSSILGNNLSVGLGVASTLSADGICWIQIGDGAIEEGAFHEALILSNARDLKCIYLVENNNWSLGTSIAERRRPICLRSMAKSHKIDYFEITLDESIEGYAEILNNAKQTCSGPIIIEIHLRTEGGKDSKGREYVSYHHGCITP